MGATETQVTAGVRLAVREQGPHDASRHVLLLHGYPDDRTLWDGVLAHLPDDWHVVTVDNRGAGRSERPADVAAYATPALVADVAAVVAATVPEGEPVHLVGHDWGAIIGWEVVAAQARGEVLAGRLASYTCVSGVCLDHVRETASTWAGRRRLLPQLAHSWYVLLFALPFLPELLWRRGQPALRRLARRVDPSSPLLPWGPALGDDAVTGLGLYRALVRGRRTTSSWRSDVPVLLVQPTHDGFITARASEGLEQRCPDLRRAEVRSGHWLPRTEPAAVARLVREQVERVRR